MTTPRTTFASALSDAPDTADAVGQVVSDLSQRLNGSVDLAVVFATPHHADAMTLVHEVLRSTLAPRVELGVTCEGVIGVRREVERSPGLSILAASLPDALLEPFETEDIDWSTAAHEPEAVRAQLWPHADDEPKVVLFMADPFSTPMLSVLPGLGAALPDVPVIGGMASGAGQAGDNRVLYNGQVMSDGGVGVVIGGAVQVDTTVSQGCRPVGKPVVITKSQRHVVMQLGGRQAMAVVRELIASLPDEDRVLIQNNGLLVGRVINEYKDRFGRGDFLIRGLHGVDEDNGYIAIADPQVRVGQTIQFHVRDQRTAREDFSLLLEMQQIHGPAAGALLFSCNGRGTRLFDRPNADSGMVHHALGDAPLAGFFAAGEIGPVGGQNFVHGHTAALVVFRDG